MKIGYYWISCLIMGSAQVSFAQMTDDQKDSIYIEQVESAPGKPKVLHAEPLFIDLIRDLGARKGEKEWNVGLGLTDNSTYDAYNTLVEYEWAPINRLGLEIELPFTFYAPIADSNKIHTPGHALNSLKTAIQWTFLVNESHNISAAIGYINEIEFSSFRDFGRPLIPGNVYNPFAVIAKRWGRNWHSMMYAGPRLNHHFQQASFHTNWNVNTSIHYMISGTRNFIGMELNKVFSPNQFDMIIRPQMRLGIVDNLMIGIVVGVPVRKNNERFSTFLRLIWEPKSIKKEG